MIKPDFQNGLINLSATLSNFVGAKTNVPTLKGLEEKLNKDKKDVVFIIFDGLGVYNVENFSKKDSFYKNHIVLKISSNLPPTTTSATTTLMSGKYPDEHLFLAWTLYLKKQKRVVELYTSKDYFSKEKVLPYTQKVNCFLDRAQTDRKIYTVGPSYLNYSNKIENKVANTIDEMFLKIDEILKEKEKHFLYCYCSEPDYTMHEFGVKSKEAQEKFNSIVAGLKNLISTNKDVLILTTADHGQVDIRKYFEFDKELLLLQRRPLSMEPRFVSFKIKFGKKGKFKKLFNEKYVKYFDLIPQKEAIKQKFFGKGKNLRKLKNFIGDFIAVGNEEFVAFNINNSPSPLKGHHSGGTKEEIIVPVCVFEC